MNFFLYKTVAERYARHRPYFHPLVVEKIKATLNLRQPLEIALDVGCGSGQSTLALKAIADFVIGMDISAEMLAVAHQISAMQYVQSSAEVMPIQNSCCDLLTTFLAFHWFDQARFFAEAKRILKDRAWLIISNNGFSGQMMGNPSFEEWLTRAYLKRYPTPPRHSAPLTPEGTSQHGFHFAYQENYQNEIEFRVEELAAYLTTQSNVIAATEQGKESVDDVYHWLTTEIQPFFKTEKARFSFGGYIWYLRKTNDSSL